MKSFVFAVCCLSLASLVLTTEPMEAQKNYCDALPRVGTCSYVNINGSCEINVDRANAVSFPTIYMKPGSTLTVNVYNVSPFESLTLDLSSLTSALRPDAFQTIFNSLTPSASKATAIANKQLAFRLHPAAPPRPNPSLDVLESQAEQLIYKQNQTIDETDASLVLQQIALAVQGPTSGSCVMSVQTTTDEFPNPWFDLDKWKQVIATRLTTAEGGTGKNQAALTAEATPLTAQINALKQSVVAWNAYGDPNRSAQDQQRLDHANQILDALLQQQPALLEKIAIRGDQGDKNDESDRLKALGLAIAAVSAPAFDKTPPATENVMKTSVIDVPRGSHAFNVSGVWALNSSNILSGAVALLSQSSYSATPLPASYTQVGSAVTKTQVMSVTIQSTNREWVEASAGFVVPWRGYHSYTAAAQASTGSVVDNVVQQTLTHTVVPAAFANVNLLEIPSRHGSWAFFISPFIGYNATTSSVETGIGPSISWRSIELNFMADYANDTHLSGGFSVGQSLGATNPASPLTVNSYSWRFAPGISIRIPLGGSSSTSSGAGGTATAGSTSGTSTGSSGSGKHH